MPKLKEAVPASSSIRVKSWDAVVGTKLCLALFSTGFFQRVVCDDEDPTETRDVLVVSSDVSESSRDYGRNTGYSALSLGTLLLVSSSAKTTYRFELQQGRRTKGSYRVNSRGRIGMWAVLPVLMGLAGTNLGTFFNGDAAPENLRAECAGGNATVDPDRKNCILYEAFQEDSLAAAWGEIWALTRTALMAGRTEAKEKERMEMEKQTSVREAEPIIPAKLICEKCSHVPRPKEKSFDLVVYQAQAVREIFVEIMSGHEHHYVDAHLTAVGLNYKLPAFIQRLTFETEGLIVKHDGMQNHWETDLMLVARLTFLKDTLPVSFAFGKGMSYAWKMPTIEGDEEDDTTNALLNFFIVEMDVGLPNISWNPRLLLRIHHRSGVFGVYCPKTCGSNFLSAGFKVAF